MPARSARDGARCPRRRRRASRGRRRNFTPHRGRRVSTAGGSGAAATPDVSPPRSISARSPALPALGRNTARPATGTADGDGGGAARRDQRVHPSASPSAHLLHRLDLGAIGGTNPPPPGTTTNARPRRGRPPAPGCWPPSLGPPWRCAHPPSRSRLFRTSPPSAVPSATPAPSSKLRTLRGSSARRASAGGGRWLEAPVLRPLLRAPAQRPGSCWRELTEQGGRLGGMSWPKLAHAIVPSPSPRDANRPVSPDADAEGLRRAPRRRSAGCLSHDPRDR